MKIRKSEYGTCNVIGRRVEAIRKERGIKQKEFVAKLQSMGLDINPTSFSKLEGQVRLASDKEVYYIAKALEIQMEELFDNLGN